MSLTVEKCLQAWTNSLRQMNAKADIVFFGDSLTYYGDFSSVFPDKVVCNLGMRGDTIQGMIKRLEQLSLLEPEKVYLMAGINDVANCKPEIFKSLYETLVCRLKRVVPISEIVIQSILPVNNKDYTISCNNIEILKCNRLISSIASKYGLDYIDLHSLYFENDLLPSKFTVDGMHLKIEAYSIWLDKIKTSLLYNESSKGC